MCNATWTKVDHAIQLLTRPADSPAPAAEPTASLTAHRCPSCGHPLDWHAESGCRVCDCPCTPNTTFYAPELNHRDPIHPTIGPFTGEGD